MAFFNCGAIFSTLFRHKNIVIGFRKPVLEGVEKCHCDPPAKQSQILEYKIARLRIYPMGTVVLRVAFLVHLGYLAPFCVSPAMHPLKRE